MRLPIIKFSLRVDSIFLTDGMYWNMNGRGKRYNFVTNEHSLQVRRHFVYRTVLRIYSLSSVNVKTIIPIQRTLFYSANQCTAIPSLRRPERCEIGFAVVVLSTLLGKYQLVASLVFWILVGYSHPYC